MKDGRSKTTEYVNIIALVKLNWCARREKEKLRSKCLGKYVFENVDKAHRKYYKKENSVSKLESFKCWNQFV